MEKSLEQLKHIERISRQTRHHRTHLNQVHDQSLRTELNHLANEREQSILRSNSRRRLEEERKQVFSVTIDQIVRERQQQQQQQSRPINTTQIEQETVQVLSKDYESRPSSSVKLPPAGTSCHLFSHNCQLYPCQPIYQYTSIIKKEHDKIVRKRNPSVETPKLPPTTSPHLRQLFTKIQDKKYQENNRQLAVVIQNQDYLVNRKVSMQRAMTRFDEQSRLLKERLADKKTFGYVRERQRRLTQDIERHLKITAKFCA